LVVVLPQAALRMARDNKVSEWYNFIALTTFTLKKK
jgi:hypothetical protein